MTANLWSAPLLPVEETLRLAEIARQAKPPYRAVDPRVLRGIHSLGQVLRPDKLERTESRAIERPIEEMSLDDLIATQGMEPLSESRRSFLTTGSGVLSLDAVNEEADEFISLADAMSGEFLVEIDHADPDHRDAVRYGVPYETIDLVTQRQIEWEDAQAQCGNTHVYRVTPSEDGGISLKKISGWTPTSTFMEIARRVKGYLRTDFGIEAGTSYAELESRMALVAEGLRTNGLTRSARESAAYLDMLVTQMSEMEDETAHSTHEVTAPALLGRRGRIYLNDDLDARQYARLERAGAEPVIVVTGLKVRNGQKRHNPADDLWVWHHTARDANELDVTGIADALPRTIRFVRLAA